MIKKIIYALIFAFIMPLVVFSQQPTHNKKIMGYYAQWSIYARDYNVSRIDGSKLTHLMYAFFGTTYDAANPSGAKLLSLDSYADFEHTEGGAPWDAPVKGNFYDLQQLKIKYPHLKIIVSVGGWTKSQNFPAIAASQIARDALAADMAAFIVKYPFIDGFDIDWEFPVEGGTDGTEVIGGSTVPAQPHNVDDHKNLVYLLKAMRLAMPNKFISIAAGNSVTKVPNQFIGTVNKAAYGMTDDITTYCDLVSFFGYDFGGNWYDKTCYNAPLYGSGNTNDPLHGTTVQSLDVLVNKFLNEVGIPKEKLVMGVPYYGKIFDNVANNGTLPNLPGLFVAAPRVSGGCTNPQPPKGTWDIASCENSGSVEFCDLAGTIGTNAHHILDPSNSSVVSASAASAGWIRYWDDIAKVPYLYNATTHQFITYDDKQSIDEKSKFIASKNLAGAMVWELSQDIRPVSLTDPSAPSSLLAQLNTTFSATPVTVGVTIKTPSNVAISGVSVVLKKISDATTTTLVTDTNGSVSFASVVPYLEYEISYTKAGFSFLPQKTLIAAGSLGSNTTYNVVGSDQVVTISGSVKAGTPSVLLPNVTVNLFDSSNTVLSTVISTDGNFSFSGIIAGGNYKVSAIKSSYTFVPVVLNNITTNQSNIAVLGTFVSYTISGVIKDGATLLQGVTVSAIANGTTYTGVSGSNGAYSISGLPSATYTVSASKAGQAFLPTTTSINLTSNTTQDFVLNGYLMSGTVKNGTAPVSGAKVEIILPYVDATHPWVSTIAITDAQGKYFLTNAQISGYVVFSSIKINAWDNGNVTYLPSAGYPQESIPTVPKTYDFNTQVLATDTFTNSNSNLVGYLSSGTLNVSCDKNISQVRVYNLLGQLLVNQKVNNTTTVQVEDANFSNKQLFILEVIDEQGHRSVLKLY